MVRNHKRNYTSELQKWRIHIGKYMAHHGPMPSLLMAVDNLWSLGSARDARH